MSHLQQCGYECKCFSLLNNLFSCANHLQISSLQSLTNLPAQGSTSGTNFPDLSTKLINVIPFCFATKLSSSPYAGAICTIPVPSVSVT